MSEKTERDQLAREFEALPELIDDLDFSGNGAPVILARLVRGFPREAWQRARGASDLDQWHALPLAADEAEEEPDALDCGALPVSPFREVGGALTRSAFISLLRRELLRLSRNGGNLSLLSASLANRSETETALGKQTVRRLDSILGATLLSRMDICDSLGLVKNGIFMCSLPGLGQLAARNFAETASSAFSHAAHPFFPAGGLCAGRLSGCAIGIVNVMQGEATTVENLLKRGRAALEAALLKQGSQIHQESTLAPFEGTTLVHSSEKRFLFFGGDPQ